jgi:2'-5' RNA ligase
MRLFVALDLPADVRGRLAAWRDGLVAGREDLRPVAEHALHVTLAFLGYRAEKEAVAIAEAMRSAATGEAPRLIPGEVRPIPPRRPRLFALDLEDPDSSCGRLQQAVSDALEAGRFYTPEKRPFWPHVTLARVKRNQRAEPLPADPPPLEPFRAGQVTLYRSTLRPQGAQYDALAQAELAPGYGLSSRFG